MSDPDCTLSPDRDALTAARQAFTREPGPGEGCLLCEGTPAVRVAHRSPLGDRRYGAVPGKVRVHFFWLCAEHGETRQAHAAPIEARVLALLCKTREG